MIGSEMAGKDYSSAIADLDGRELAYVQARIHTDNIKAALELAGLATMTFYRHVPPARRKQLDELVRQYKADTVGQAMQILQDNAKEAARVKAEGLKSRKQHIAQAASDSILDRVLGKPKQRMDISGRGRVSLIEEIVRRGEGSNRAE